jgi:hypothetical protein
VLKVQFVKGEITRKEVVWFYSVEEEEKRRGGDWVYFSVFVNLFVEYFAFGSTLWLLLRRNHIRHGRCLRGGLVFDLGAA